MSGGRFTVLLSVLRGLIAAVCVTLAGMLLIALLAVMTHISDNLILALNQLLKAASICIGTFFAVGRGGSRGFVTGAVLALIYMISGYGMYVLLGGGAYSTTAMLGEILIGAAIGAVIGAILANMRPKSRRRVKTA